MRRTPSGKQLLSRGLVVTAIVLVIACGDAKATAPALPSAATLEVALAPSPSTQPVPTRSAAIPTSSPDLSVCSGRDPASNVYRPTRLIVLETCVTATGTVMSVRSEPDGDLHIQLRLDPGQEALLNRGNLAEQSGALVVEIICVGTAVQQDAVAACANYASRVEIPTVGRHVAITGPHVLDTQHDWMEIHPVYEWHGVP